MSPKITNRKNQRSRWRTFYVPLKKFAGAGVKDCYGRVYMAQPDGSLRLITDAKAETINQ